MTQLSLRISWFFIALLILFSVPAFSETVFSDADDPEEGDLPEWIAAQYPGYKDLGSPEIWEKKKEEGAWLVKDPEGNLVLLCGTDHGEEGWTIIESTPLPEGTKVVLNDELWLLDTGSVQCAVRRYSGDTWGIGYIGWKKLFVGPNWIGYMWPTTLLCCTHPWADLTTIDWTTLADSLREAMKYMDVTSCAAVKKEDPDSKTPLYVSPDPESEKIADLFGRTPLFVIERNGEWTRVSLGRGTQGQWEMEGWIRTEELEFMEKPNITHLYVMSRYLGCGKDQSVTLLTPRGSTEVSSVNSGFQDWFAIGEQTIDGREYWLMYECYTEQIGFILKEELRKAVG